MAYKYKKTHLSEVTQTCSDSNWRFRITYGRENTRKTDRFEGSFLGNEADARLVANVCRDMVEFNGKGVWPDCLHFPFDKYQELYRDFEARKALLVGTASDPLLVTDISIPTGLNPSQSVNFSDVDDTVPEPVQSHSIETSGDCVVQIPLTVVEKKQLIAQIAKLPLDRMEVMLTLIPETAIPTSDEEDGNQDIEVSLDALDTFTQRKLQRFIEDEVNGITTTPLSRSSRVLNPPSMNLLSNAFERLTWTTIGTTEHPIRALVMRPVKVRTPLSRMERVKIGFYNLKRDLETHQRQSLRACEVYKKLMHTLLINKTHTLIIKYPVTDAKFPGRFIAPSPSPEDSIENDAADFSSKQLQRVITQCLMVSNVARVVHLKHQALVDIMSKAVALLECESFTDKSLSHIEQILKESRRKVSQSQSIHGMSKLVSGVLHDFNCGGDASSEQLPRLFSVKTIRKWYNQYLTKLGFLEDLRGSYERDFFLEEHHMQEQFVLYMSTSKQLTVDMCVLFVNNMIKESCANSIDELITKYHLKYPINRSTVYRWMIKSGAKYEPHSQSYYTDRHDAPDTVKDRNERYLVECDTFSLREACWVSVPLDKASPESLEHVMRVMGVATVTDLPTFQVDDVVCTKVHVDYLAESEFVKYRLQMLKEKGRPGEYLFNTHNGCATLTPSFICAYGHDVTKCKCFLPLIRIGQDEAVFKQNALCKMCWSIREKKPMWPKNDGPGRMVSAVQDEYRGFGFPMTQGEIDKMNRALEKDGHPTIAVSPGTVFLDIGSGRDGYWNAEQMSIQVRNLMYAFEAVYEDMQLVFEVDQSSGHLARRPDGLCVSNMNLGWGGKQNELRATVIVEGCLGEQQLSGNARRLQLGDVQHMVFQATDPPPFQSPHAPKYDRPMTQEERKQYDKKKATAIKAKEKRRAKVVAAAAAAGVEPIQQPLPRNVQARVQPAQRPQSVHPQAPDPAVDPYWVLGYVDKPKGIAQVLHDRGLWHPDMVLEITEAERRERTAKGLQLRDEGLSASHVLSECTDFKLEKGILQTILESHGHILFVSPKCHPELAGLGIEYSWGLTKREFRKWNDCVYKNLAANVTKALSVEHLTLSNVLKFARRTRDYCRTYRAIATSTVSSTDVTYTLIEKMLKIQKTHRSILDMEGKYLNSVSTTSRQESSTTSSLNSTTSRQDSSATSSLNSTTSQQESSTTSSLNSTTSRQDSSATSSLNSTTSRQESSTTSSLNSSTSLQNSYLSMSLTNYTASASDSAVKKKTTKRTTREARSPRSPTPKCVKQNVQDQLSDGTASGATSTENSPSQRFRKRLISE